MNSLNYKDLIQICEKLKTIIGSITMEVNFIFFFFCLGFGVVIDS